MKKIEQKEARISYSLGNAAYWLSQAHLEMANGYNLEWPSQNYKYETVKRLIDELHQFRLKVQTHEYTQASNKDLSPFLEQIEEYKKQNPKNGKENSH